MKLNIGTYAVNSLFALVGMILAEKKFSTSPEEALAEGELVVGIMNDEEKAIYTAKTMVADTHNVLVDEIRASDDPPSPETVLRVKILKKWHESLEMQFWSSLDLKHYE